jgi:two-component system, chemotaxis family, sensor kinase CheA
MNPLLEQFLSEARDFLQGIGEKLMQLEDAPDDKELMTSLFRLVHTLKGNSGLFEFPEMTRVLHAGEDLMDGVRHGRITYSKALADRLLDAMDFVGMLCDEIERNGNIGARHAADSAGLAESLRQLISSIEVIDAVTPVFSNQGDSQAQAPTVQRSVTPLPLDQIPELVRMDAYRRAMDGDGLHWLSYTPAHECFFQGDDPFFQARNTPDVLWGNITVREPWPKLADLDAYRCVLEFHLLTTAPRTELDVYYRYVPDQIGVVPITPLMLALPCGEPNGGPVYEDFVVDSLNLLEAGNLHGLTRAVQTMLEISNPDLWLSSALRWLLLVLECEPKNAQALTALITSLRFLKAPHWNALTQTEAPMRGGADNTGHAATLVLSQPEVEAMRGVVDAQRKILALPVKESWHLGRIKAVAATLAGLLRAQGNLGELSGLEIAEETALNETASSALLTWLDSSSLGNVLAPKVDIGAVLQENTVAPTAVVESENVPDRAATVSNEGDSKFGRRAEDASTGPKSLKVDQAKIDRLMNLIGEMVVSKNALPYLAGRAESVFGVRELSREIKAQYAVINRIAEEMQDAIMQVRMMPVSFVFQRFPRLVRDISRKLGKDVNLVLEGEETEADKNIIESLGDPLVHIVRNSLDHGFEHPDVRRAAGKPTVGTLNIRANQESDRVVIEIHDDGKGIDPLAIKRKAYEKGLIDEAVLERISDQDAVNLIFASGFSTADVISDLSGRGVGMDVVRTAVEKVNGTVVLESEKGKGTRIRLSLPLSMAVTNVMIVESDGQIFGIPMDCVVETVRVRRSTVRTIKKSLATVLRGRIVPLKSINTLLGLDADQRANEEDELAVLVVRVNDEPVGLMVDNFRETVDIILKPMAGVLAGLSAYSGSALMGDGTVLMVLNVKEIL